MIISHKYKFIFIAIPKTATHAIRFGVRSALGEEDIEQVNLFVQKQSPFKEFQDKNHGHMTGREVCSVLDKAVWDSYFKFAIVRNPFDRFVSYCSFLLKNNPDFQKNPEPYLYHILLDKRNHKQILFQPQSHFLLDDGGNQLMDYIGKFESLQESFDYVCSNTGLPSSVLMKINESTRLDYRAYYNDEIKSMVSDFYKKDIQLFNYKF